MCSEPDGDAMQKEIVNNMQSESQVNDAGAQGLSRRLEVYPGPGGDAYRSDLYKVELLDGATWRELYLYKMSRLAICYGWHRGKHPSVNFATFGTTGPVQVRLTRLAGAIGNVQISPKSKAIVAGIRGGQAVFTLNQNDKAWITVDGDDANPIFIYADPPKPAVPQGAEYFGPGVHEIGHLHPAPDGGAIYLDGGAWVKGNIDLRGRRGVRILGPGVLSGELWTGESVLSLPWEKQRDYFMISGDTADGDADNHLEGITIVNAPSYNTFHSLQRIYGVKLISPWFGSTDGFYLTPSPSQTVMVDQCFAFVGDDVFFPRDNFMGNMILQNSFVSSSNNNIFCLSYWAGPLNHEFTTLARNIDIKVCPENAVFQCVIDGRESKLGVKNHIYEEIRIEGDLNDNCRLFWIENRPYPWGDTQNSSEGNASNLWFRDITVEGRQNLPVRKSRIIGKDATNGIRDVVFENLTIAGVQITETNSDEYFEINPWARDIRFTTVPTGVSI
jgi:hypothetical protein